MIMAHFLTNDREVRHEWCPFKSQVDLFSLGRQELLRRVKEWPVEIYDVQAVIIAVQGELDSGPGTSILMECLAEL
jgi:hypothetical protein